MNLLTKLAINTDYTNVLFIAGPTASGKTGLALKIAKELQNQSQNQSQSQSQNPSQRQPQNQPQKVAIISADSRQIYIHMTVCTAKPAQRLKANFTSNTLDPHQSPSPNLVSTNSSTSKAALNPDIYKQPITYDGVEHYLFDICYPDQRYTVFDFQSQAQALIQQLHQTNHKVIVAGGTGLYIDSLINNYSLKSNSQNHDFKNQLIQEFEINTQKKSLLEAKKILWHQLFEVLPHEAQNIHPNNHHRVIRALEVYHTAKASKNSLNSKSEPAFDYQMLVLNPDRDKLYHNINQRCLDMFDQDLIGETQFLLQNYPTSTPSMTSIGYKQVQQYLNQELSLQDCIASFQQATRNYAKRQITWFKRYQTNPHTQFIDPYNFHL